MKQIAAIVFILLCSLIVIPTINAVVNSKSIRVDEEKVIYTLPYPGILRDHPLYFLKETRDQILAFTTRDDIKKAQLFLNLSDKHLSIAIKLSEKGKEQLVIKELTQSYDYFKKIIPLLKSSKKQGVSPSNDFIMRLYQSNAKHSEMIAEILKKTTQANIESINSLLELNNQLKKSIGEVR